MRPFVDGEQSRQIAGFRQRDTVENNIFNIAQESALSCPAFVTVVPPSHFRQLHDSAGFRRLQRFLKHPHSTTRAAECIR